MLKLTAHKGDPCEFCNVPHDDVPKGPCKARLAQLADEEITSDWLSEHFKVEPYCWKLPVEGYYLGATTSGYYRGRFDVFRVEDDGDETTIGQVATALHLLNLLNVIALAESVAVIRDNVLHERNQMAEAGFDSDKVNAVLGIIDDAASKPLIWSSRLESSRHEQ